MLAIGEREAPAGWPCQAKRRGDFLRHDRVRLLVALVVRIDTLSTLWAEEVIRHRQARLQDVAASRWPEARGQPLGCSCREDWSAGSDWKSAGRRGLRLGLVVNDLLLAPTARADESYVRNERVSALQ